MKKSLEERFWSKVQKTPTCWRWTGCRSGSFGYGQITVMGVNGKWTGARAHRVSWEIAYGPIPTGMQVLHKCDDPLCVRPDHLFLGTQLDNMRDKMRKGRHHQIVGVDHYNAKLNETAVREIRQLWATGARSQREIAVQFGIDPSHVSNIVNLKSWAHLEGGA